MFVCLFCVIPSLFFSKEKETI